jgi:predicted lipoprotein with Yx(FWY)xxD motif
MKNVTRSTAPVIKASVFLGLAALLVAGCASKNSKSAAASSAPATTAAAPATTAAAAAGTPAPSAPASSAAAVAPVAASVSAAGGSAAAAGPATVDVKTGPLGAYLTDASGNTLYLFTPDTTPASTCYGKCAGYWPAFVTSAAPQAGSGAEASLLGTSKRTDGTTQVTYNGHPLYFFKGDKAAGDTSGQGTQGTWFLVSPAGKQIGSPKPPSASASTAAKAIPPSPSKAAPTVSPSASKSTTAGGGWS